jgi:DNA (cytosine-5)-methyltransferase 1
MDDNDDKNKGKKPNLRRHFTVKSLLKNSLININSEWVDTQDTDPTDKTYYCVDLFSGAGGISCGFEMAGINPILGIEIDPIAAETYEKNFPNTKLYCGDIRKMSLDKIKELIGNKPVHILAGGFPCQGFSIAGYRDPDDKRNVLYKEVVRIVKEIKPWFVVLENVPGIISMEKGQVYKRIIEDFESIGYSNMSVHILEAADYGVAQLRPRTIFIANRFDLPNPYPMPHLKPEEYNSIESAIDDLKYSDLNPSINHVWPKHSKSTIERIKKIKPGCSLYDRYVDAFKRQYRGVPSMTIKENHGGSHIHYELDRCITPREMARLQSFPDSFIFAGNMKKAMWQIGNAVAPILFKNIGLALIQKLDEIEESNLYSTY